MSGGSTCLVVCALVRCLANELIQSSSVVVAVCQEDKAPAATRPRPRHQKTVIGKLIRPFIKQANSATTISRQLRHQPRQIRTWLLRNSKSCTKFCVLGDV